MEYARPELLAETDWLAERLMDPEVRIVDMGSQEAYNRVHIPNAVHITVHHYLKDLDDGINVMGPNEFSQLMSILGISNDTTVVAYDEGGAHWAARLWWVLDYYGHTKCKLLNGGWNKWLAEGRPLSCNVPAFPRAHFYADAKQQRICLTDELKGYVGSPNVVIWDVRTQGEWDGSNPRTNRRGGHIPGAVHLDWVDTVTKDDIQAFKSADQLKKLLDQTGIPKSKDVVVHCQAGVRASHGAFTLALMGYDKYKVYDASWNAWGNRDDTPIVKE